MKKLHIVYPEDNKTMMSFVKLVIDDQEYILKKRIPQVIEVEGDAHKLIVKGNLISNMDVSLNSDGPYLKTDTKEKIWCDIDINLVEEDEYYIFKTPLFLSWKGKLIKVTKDVFDKKSK